MEFRVLGTIEVAGPSPSPSPPGAKERAILARLLLDPGRAVPADALLDAAWEGVARDVAARSLAVRVANLRSFLEPGRDRGAPSSLLVRDGPGYRLAIAPEQVDAQRFERSVHAAAALPPSTALETLDGALALWRGTPFGELAGAEWAQAEVRRLEDLRCVAEEGRARALVELGRPLEAVPDLRRLMLADPLREELACTLMLALYGAGRQVEALAVYRDLAARLRELGLTPGETARALERRILEHDPTLAPAGPAPAHGIRRPAPIGRERELSRLRAALAAAVGGRRVGVMLSGEPGVGKSTLVDALAEEAGVAVGVGQCLGHRGPGEPYMPVLGAIGELARGPAGETVVATLAQAAPTWLVELPWLLCNAPEAEAVRQRAQGATRARMLREMLEALDAIAATAPLLLVLEDLHWADDSTLDLLAALLRRREPAPLLVLGTFRPGGEPPVAALVNDLSVRELCDELPVGRLSPRSVAAYVEKRFPAAPAPDGLADVLAQRTGGNPLFMRNLLDHWLAEGALAEHAGTVRLMRSRESLEAGVPPTLRAHIRDQLEGLPDEDAEVLRAASVAGRDFSVDTLAAALERDREEVEARCAALAQRTPLIERRDGGHGFPHDLHREVLYELLPADARARLHARVGAHLADAYGPAAPEMAAELGFHFLAGRDPERAVTFLRIAAERALGRNAHAEGIRHLRSALDAAAELGAGSERTRAEVELLSSLGQALVATGGWSAAEAEDALLRARALAARLSDNEPLVSLLLALATLYEMRGEFSRAQDMAQECRRLAPSGPAGQQLESTELLACNLFHQGSFARALEYADRGVTLFEDGDAPGSYTTFPATLGDNAAVSCHDWAGLALWFLGRPDAALARATRALELARDPSRAYSLATARAQMAIVHQVRREPEAAIEWAEAAIAARTEARLRLPRGDGARAARLVARRPRRSRAGRARGHRRVGGVTQHRRTDGRPALPGAARRRTAARRRRARRPGRRGRGARARAARALAVLRTRAAPARRRAAGGVRRRRRGRGIAAPRAGARARAGLRRAGAADRDRPRAAAARPARGPRTRARTSRPCWRRSARASARATCARRPRCWRAVSRSRRQP